MWMHTDFDVNGCGAINLLSAPFSHTHTYLQCVRVRQRSEGVRVKDPISRRNQYKSPSCEFIVGKPVEIVKTKEPRAISQIGLFPANRPLKIWH